MWKLSEKILKWLYGEPYPLYIRRPGTKLLTMLDGSMVFINVTDEYVGWVIGRETLTPMIFKRKVNQGVTILGLWGSNDSGYPTRYFQGVTLEQVEQDLVTYAKQVAGYVPLTKENQWPPFAGEVKY